MIERPVIWKYLEYINAPLLLGLRLAHTASLGQLAKGTDFWVDAVLRCMVLQAEQGWISVPLQADTLVQWPYLLYER